LDLRKAVAGLLLLASYGWAGDPAPVILISVDTLRADHLGAYGYARVRTPSFDSFAEHGTVFTNVQSQIPLTLPSHTSLFSSTYPFESRVEENGQSVPPGLVTLAAVLRAHGYKTAAFIGSSFLDRRYGLDPGFDLYDSPFTLPGDSAENPYSQRVRRDGPLVTRAALGWLAANRGEPVFVFVHLYDLHTPYKLSPNGSLRPALAGYDAEIEYIDQVLGRFRQALKQAGWWDRSLVLLLSDHGESLGDHGESSHGYFIYRSTVWVPLLVHWPSGTDHFPERDDRPAGLIDVAPTILDFLHIAPPSSFQGVSLLGAPRPESHIVYTESVYMRDTFRWAALRSIQAGDYKFIQAPKPELYNLQTDPRERTNIILKNPGKAETLRTELTQLLARTAPGHANPAGNASAQTRALLESSGYLAGRRRASSNDSGPDPKDRIAEYETFEGGLESLYAGRFDAAIAAFRNILLKDPRNLPARGNLGDCYLKAGRPDAALREWTAALHDDPEYAPAAEALGEFWLGRREYAKARSFFERVLNVDVDDSTAHRDLAIADENLGLRKEALEHLRTACKLQPYSTQCQQELHALEARTK
jgi:arylsulfatase A-like enzyme/Flp pilus assembly protein TadD